MIEALLALILVLAVLSARTYAALRAPRVDATQTRRLGRSRGWNVRSVRPGLTRARAALCATMPHRLSVRLAQAMHRAADATTGALLAGAMGRGPLAGVGAVGMVHRADPGSLFYASRYATLQLAVDAAAASGVSPPTVILDQDMSGGAVTVPRTVQLIMHGIYTYTGAGSEAAITLGDNAGGIEWLNYRLRVQRQSTADWTSEADVGVRIINANTCHIDLDEVVGFTIGAQARGDSGGFAYNTVRLGYLANNKYALDLDAITSGWVNENTFTGGRFSVTTGTNSTLARYGVRITSSDASYANNNNNRFYGPSFELNASDASAEAVGLLIEHGVYNHFDRCRTEGNDVFGRTLNSSQSNTATIGYSAATTTIWEDSGTYPSTTVQNLREGYPEQLLPTIFKSGHIAKRSTYADGATSVHIPGLHCFNNATIQRSVSGVTPGTDYLEFAGAVGVGVYVDTTNIKRFVLRRDVTASAYGGRVNIRCYDSGGAALTSAGGAHPYVKSLSNTTFTYTASYGGAYRTGSDSNIDLYFEVGDDVKSIAIGLSPGTANLRLRGFSVHSAEVGTNAYPATWTGTEGVGVPGASDGTAAPTNGTHERGKVVFNSTPSASGILAWICTTAGTPGTWSPLYLNGGGDAATVASRTPGAASGVATLDAGTLVPLAQLTHATDYADGLVEGLRGKGIVAAVSDANVAALSGTPTVDGVVLVANDVVLLTAQTTASENGPWVVAAGAWARPANFAAGSSAANAFWLAEAGTSYADTRWWVTTDSGSDVVDTNTLTVSRFSGAAEITAGTGLTKTGNTVDLDTATTGAIGGVLQAAALTAPAPSALTDNTGVVTPDAIIENIAATSSPADAAPTGTSAGAGAATLSTNAVATTASVDTAFSTLQTRINALPTKASVDAALAACENNISDLATMVNILTARLEDVIALQVTAGQQTTGP